MRIDRSRLRGLKKRLSPEQYEEQLARSVALLKTRQSARPRIEIPTELPISASSRRIGRADP